MSPHELTAPEARAIVRRQAHDLRNMINCMDLEITCVLEDPASTAVRASLQKLRDQLTLTERTIYSLSVRFREPSLSVAAAADIFYNWQQQLHKLGKRSAFQWEEPQCTATVTVDFSAVIAVLVEICLQAKHETGAPAPVAVLAMEDDAVVFSLREPAAEFAFPTDVQQWEEWERLTGISGGRLERTGEEDREPRVTRLIFPSV